jgi:hypothetical protein
MTSDAFARGHRIERIDAARGKREFRVAHAGEAGGSLTLTGGVADLDLRGGDSAESLATASFENHLPTARVDSGRIAVTFRRLDPLGTLRFRGKPRATIRLNKAVPWTIELRDGVSGLRADLTDIRLRGLTIGGGLTNAEVRLPPPASTVTIRINSGVSGLRVHRPAGVPVRVQVQGSATGFTFDNKAASSSGPGLVRETGDWAIARDRYDIVLGSGATRVQID